MIKNEREYRITKAHAESFKKVLAQLSETSRGQSEADQILYQLQEDTLRGQIEELSLQLEEYDALRTGEIKVLELDSFADLPIALIKARIAAGLSQDDLADRLGLKKQ